MFVSGLRPVEVAWTVRMPVLCVIWLTFEILGLWNWLAYALAWLFFDWCGLV